MKLEDVRYNEDDNWYDRHILRKFSIHISRIIVHTPITANQVTASRFIVGVLASALFLFGRWEYSVIGAFLIFFFSGVLDQVDGEVARFKNQISVKGLWLDYIVHRNLPPIIIVAVGYGSYVSTGNILYFIAGVTISLFLLTTMSMALIRVVTILQETGKKVEDVELQKDRGRGADYYVNAFLSAEIMEVVLIIFALINRMHYLIIWCSIFVLIRLSLWLIRFGGHFWRASLSPKE